jgi:hypothetical protein
MAKALIAQGYGHDYQVSLFWREAARLFIPEASVVRVDYEADRMSGFDDVVVWYADGFTDGGMRRVIADAYQVKFHIDHQRAATTGDLMDPGFIGGTAFSLLQRLHALYKSRGADAQFYRFHLVTPWGINPDDPLKYLVENSDGRLRLDLLFDGTTDRSQMGQIRSAWREHLELETDAELRNVLETLRIRTNYGDLQSLRSHRDSELQNAGFRRPEAGMASQKYEELIPNLYAEGIHEFDRDLLRRIAEKEGLWVGRPAAEEEALRLGIRSFVKGAEHLGDRTHRMLCLLDRFRGRALREGEDWVGSVRPALASFLAEAVDGDKPIQLHLDTHSSVAFAAGFCLDPKVTPKLTLVQKLPNRGPILWEVLDGAADDADEWTWEIIETGTGGPDVALSLAITQPVHGDVELFQRETLPTVGRIFRASVLPRIGPAAVRNGDHAVRLAREVSRTMKAERTPEERQATLHIFMAGPNAFALFLGQVARSFGQCVVYEYDFDSNLPGAYQPALVFPAD